MGLPIKTIVLSVHPVKRDVVAQLEKEDEFIHMVLHQLVFRSSR
jgi:hypothetical protein